MREIIKMLVVLTLISTVSGLALGYTFKITEEPIKIAEFKFAKEPALKYVLPAYENDLVEDQYEIERGDEPPITIYPAKIGGQVVAVGFESSGKGFGGGLRIMVGIDIEKKILRGIGIVAHAETPGLGSRVEEIEFREQFAQDFPLDSVMALKSAGGNIDAISGASISSAAVCEAVNKAFEFFINNEDSMAKPSAGSTETTE